MKRKPIFITSPHGAQSLINRDTVKTPSGLVSTGQLSNHRIGNCLFSLKDDCGNEVVMTGEELNSLAVQWLNFAYDPLTGQLG